MNGTIWRRNYFFCTSIRTLLEITSAIHKLNSVPEFQNAVEKSWSEEDKGKYKEFCKDIETAKQLVKEMRNIIGGHVKHTVVARALQEPHICFDRFLGIPSRP
jgi:ABC-type cobalamin/Fe3+-siderophores transport system ATPase subunit